MRDRLDFDGLGNWVLGPWIVTSSNPLSWLFLSLTWCTTVIVNRINQSTFQSAYHDIIPATTGNLIIDASLVVLVLNLQLSIDWYQTWWYCKLKSWNHCLAGCKNCIKHVCPTLKLHHHSCNSHTGWINEWFAKHNTNASLKIHTQTLNLYKAYCLFISVISVRTLNQNGHA